MKTGFFDRILARLDKPETPEIIAKRKRYEAYMASKKTSVFVASLERTIPSRFREATLENYEVYSEAQRPILKQFNNIAENVEKFIEKKMWLCCIGSVGTGKDHLCVGLLRKAAVKGVSAAWMSAREFAYQAASTGQEETFRQWRLPKMLCISDAIVTNVSTRHQTYLNDLIRVRYDDCKSTLLTINVKDKNEAEKLMGADVFDRVSENLILLTMKWESHRRKN